MICSLLIILIITQQIISVLSSDKKIFISTSLIIAWGWGGLQERLLSICSNSTPLLAALSVCHLSAAGLPRLAVSAQLKPIRPSIRYEDLTDSQH